MAEKRMLSKVITKQDEFLDMPLSAQSLYFHLNLEADDEGFVSNIKSLLRQVRANDDDLKILIAKRYILTFESGVIVIKHWLIHNTIRQDRIQETTYQEEKAQLMIKDNFSYTDKKDVLLNENNDVGHTSDTCPPNNTNLFYTNLTKLFIDYLNKKCNTKYRHNNTRTVSYIKARVEEGYVEEDFYKVIDTKYDDWYGTEMAKHLNPETLLRPSNFEKYVNQIKTDKPKNDDELSNEELAKKYKGASFV